MELKLMTSKELAEHFNVSMKTIQRWVDRGCPYKNPPGMTRRRFFRLDLVNEWLYSSSDSNEKLVAINPSVDQEEMLNRSS